MILSAQTIRSRLSTKIKPFYERTVFNGMSFGLSSAGYDLRVKDGYSLEPGQFVLATTVEWLEFPDDVLGQLVDKSTWARRGIAVQNTVFEPGWRGYPTIEISNHSDRTVIVEPRNPIAQMIFHLLDEPSEQAYRGKYQDQPQRPVGALEEAPKKDDPVDAMVEQVRSVQPVAHRVSA